MKSNNRRPNIKWRHWWPLITAFTAGIVILLGTLPILAQTQSYPFPIDAGSLHLGTYAITSNNHYDLSLRRFSPETNQWSGLKDPVNGDLNNVEDYLIYGVPVKASASGEVITCWRNAPDSPIEGPHPRRDGCDGSCSTGENCSCTIPRSGNHIQVLTDDDRLLLYAHLAPGTVPAKFCPYNASFITNANDTSGPNRHNPDMFISEGDRPRVNVGDTIGLVGSSGASGSPHLHNHLRSYNRANGDREKLPLNFNNLWIQPRQSSSNADPNNWQAFNGNELTPNNNTLLYPGYLPNRSYARHGISSEDFRTDQKRFKDSGYQIKSFDGYSVGGDVFFNYSIDANSEDQHFVRALNQSQFQQTFTTETGNGYLPIMMEAYLSPSGQKRYAGLFRKESGTFVTRHGVDLQAHRAALAKAKELGLAPMSLSVVSINGERTYTSLYRDIDIGNWEIGSRISANQLRDKLTEMREKDLYPLSVSSYLHEDSVHYAIIFTQRGNAQTKFLFNIDGADYQQAFDEFGQQGYTLTSVSGVLGANARHAYTAAWWKR